MRALVVLALLVLVVPLLLLAAGQLGLLTGKAPSGLGVKDGKLKPPSRTPNSVSSQAMLWPEGDYASAYAQIEPLQLRGDGTVSMTPAAQLRVRVSSPLLSAKPKVATGLRPPLSTGSALRAKTA